MEIPLPRKSSSKKVTFDEFELHEHDKDRGTRMEISEPDTPFMRSAIMSSDDEEQTTSTRDAHASPIVRGPCCMTASIHRILCPWPPIQERNMSKKKRGGVNFSRGASTSMLKKGKRCLIRPGTDQNLPVVILLPHFRDSFDI